MPPRKVVIEKANRLYQLPPPLFSSLKKERDKTLIKKTDILNFTRFSWNLKGLEDISISSAAISPAPEAKLNLLKEELSKWFEKHHGARIDAEKEIFIGGGARNLLLNIGLAFIDRGELVFVPELGYPHYRRVVAACGGEDVNYSVTSKSDWLPGFENVSSPIGRIARILFLNSPHNPTGATLGEKEFSKLAMTASKENVMIINDAAYQSLSEPKCPSFLAIKGATKVGAEIHSFSHTFGLPTLSFGFVAGHSEIINGLNQLSSLVPQPIPEVFCDFAIDAIRSFPNAAIKFARRQIADSRSEAMKLLDVLELEKSGYNTVPFVWAKIAGRRSSAIAAKILYHSGRIMALPGTEFGENGEGYLRFSLTALPETYIKAVQRIKKRKRLFRLIEE